MNLDELSVKYGTDKGSIVHRYTNIYEDLFFGRNIKSLLEIGFDTGASHRMWRDYFPDATIYAIDINKYGGELGERIIHCMADQSKPDELENAMKHFNTTLDIIIDDGSHIRGDILISLNTLFKYLNNGGFYIIEDIEDVESYRGDLGAYKYWTANSVNGLYNSNLIVIKKQDDPTGTI